MNVAIDNAPSVAEVQLNPIDVDPDEDELWPEVILLLPYAVLESVVRFVGVTVPGVAECKSITAIAPPPAGIDAELVRVVTEETDVAVAHAPNDDDVPTTR